MALSHGSTGGRKYVKIAAVLFLNITSLYRSVLSLLTLALSSVKNIPTTAAGQPNRLRLNY